MANLKLLKQLMGLNQNELHQLLKSYLKKKYKRVEVADKYIIAEGSIPIGLVAHLDTVHKKAPTLFFYDEEQSALWSPHGLGADDRAGVYAIIQIIEKGYRPHIIFTHDEEIGGKGASELINKHFYCPFENLKCLIELDRSGTKDCVFYDCDNKDFIKYIENFGFTYEEGSFTDISIIAPKWKAAAVNLSVGYFYEHSLAELLCVSYLDETIEKVISILDNADEMLYYEFVQREYPLLKEKDACIFCNKKLTEDNSIMISSNWTANPYDFCYYSCKDCYKKYF